MKILLFVGIIAVSLLTSCGEKFHEFKNSTDGLQIYPSKEGILKAVYPDFNGAPYLLLFSTNGELRGRVAIPDYSFSIKNWDKNIIDIEIKVAHMNYFLPWYESHKNEIVRLGDNSIVYSFKEMKVINGKEEKKFDMFSLNEKDFSAQLFLKDSLIAELPIKSLSISSEDLVHETLENGVISGERYIPVDKKIITGYLHAILSMYDVRKL
ncbi:MAG TPA: hypothetical protein VEC36_07625 [Patescibacteria group bacterium]|nr:hypothetical protein [Patescibacteria group bacterium]